MAGGEGVEGQLQICSRVIVLEVNEKQNKLQGMNRF